MLHFKNMSKINLFFIILLAGIQKNPEICMENFVLFYPVNKKADVDELLSFVLDFSAIFLHQLDDKATHLICILICVRQGHLELRVCPMRPYQTKEMALYQVQLILQSISNP